MYLTVNRRLTFAASRRFSRGEWSRRENERVYGTSEEGAWGSGENFGAHFVLDGDLDPRTGMFVNLAHVKDALDPVFEQRTTTASSTSTRPRSMRLRRPARTLRGSSSPKRSGPAPA